MENSKSFPSPEESVWKCRLVRLAWLFTASLQVCYREVVLVSSFSISGAAVGLQKHIIISPFNYIKQTKKKEQNYCKHSLSYCTVNDMIHLSTLKDGGFRKLTCLFFSLRWKIMCERLSSIFSLRCIWQRFTAYVEVRQGRGSLWVCVWQECVIYRTFNSSEKSG